MARLFGDELDELSIIVISDIHNSFENVSSLSAHLLHSPDLRADALFCLGDIISHKADTKLTVYDIADYSLIYNTLAAMSTLIVLVPGNHDPAYAFCSPAMSALDSEPATPGIVVPLHGCGLRLAPGLVLYGLGGSSTTTGTYKGAPKVWAGYPYNDTNTEMLCSEAWALRCVLGANSWLPRRVSARRRDFREQQERAATTETNIAANMAAKYRPSRSRSDAESEVSQQTIWEQTRRAMGLTVDEGRSGGRRGEYSFFMGPRVRTTATANEIADKIPELPPFDPCGTTSMSYETLGTRTLTNPATAPAPCDACLDPCANFRTGSETMRVLRARRTELYATGADRDVAYPCPPYDTDRGAQPCASDSAGVTDRRQAPTGAALDYPREYIDMPVVRSSVFLTEQEMQEGNDALATGYELAEDDCALVLTHAGPEGCPTAVCNEPRLTMDAGLPGFVAASVAKAGAERRLVGWCHGHTHAPQAHQAEFEGVQVMNPGPLADGYFGHLVLRRGPQGWVVASFTRHVLPGME